MPATTKKQVDPSHTIEYQRTVINDMAGDLHTIFTGTAALSVTSISIGGNPVTGGISSTDNLPEGSSNLYFTSERVDDRVNTLVTAGTGITKVYDDTANTYTLSVTQADINTDNITEGSTNLFSTSARTRGHISVAGSLAYNSGTGVISYTTPNSDGITEGSTNLYFTNERVDDRVNALFIAGTGITRTYDDAGNTYQMSIGQSVATTSAVTFDKVTLGTSAVIDGPSIITIDPANAGSSGKVVIAGDLQVTGSTTTIDSTTLTTADLAIRLAKDAANAAAADGAGLEVKDANLANFKYDNTNGYWESNIPIKATSFVGIDADMISEGNSKAEIVDSGSDGRFIVETEGDERFRIDHSGHISQGGGSTPTSQNGGIGLMYGIKSAANNIIIGETTSSSNNGLIFESRITGRSGGARCSQVLMGDGLLKFSTAASGAGVTERFRITPAGNVNQTINADAVGFNQTAAGNHYVKNVVNANRSGAGASILALHANWNSKDVAAIKFRTGADTTNKDDGHICFETSSANNITERLRITSGGQHNFKYVNSQAPRTYSNGSHEGLMISVDRDDINNFLGTVDFAVGRASDNTNGGTQMRFWTQPRVAGAAAAARMKIDSSGSVLIGPEGAPSTTITAAGAATFAGSLTIAGLTQTGQYNIGNFSTGDGINMGDTGYFQLRSDTRNDNSQAISIYQNGTTGTALQMAILHDGTIHTGGVNSNQTQRGQVTIFEGTDFNVGSQLGKDNIYLISDQTSAEGGYGASIAWSRIEYADRRAAAIVSVQTTADEDQVGLAFFTHSSTNASDNIVESLRIAHDGDVLPGSDATQDLGSATKRWANIYSADLQLSNEGAANEVDGTWGQYTIQEGEDDLFLINRRSGKKYKFNLTEVQ